VERKWHERYPQKFRCRTVERMNACDNIVRLARELHINRTLLYKWRHHLEATNGHVQSEATIRNSRESTFRREIDKLKRLLANKIMEVDFFRTALQKVEARSTPEQRNLWQAGVYDTIRDAVARQLECRANVPARAEARRDLRQRLSRHGGPWLQGSKNSSRGNTTGPACIQRSDTDRRGSSRCKLKPKAEAIGKCVSSGQAMRQCTRRIVSTRGSPAQLSVRVLPGGVTPWSGTLLYWTTCA